jgi:hypothetical protein
VNRIFVADVTAIRNYVLKLGIGGVEVMRRVSVLTVLVIIVFSSNVFADWFGPGGPNSAVGKVNFDMGVVDHNTTASGIATFVSGGASKSWGPFLVAPYNFELSHYRDNMNNGDNFLGNDIDNKVDGPRRGFCMSLQNTAGDFDDGEVWNIDVKMGVTGVYIEKLYGQYLSPISNGGGDGNAAAPSNDYAYALGLAIWEVLYEKSSPFDVGTGDFQVTGGSVVSSGHTTAITMANKWLANVGNDSTRSAGVYGIYDTTDPFQQPMALVFSTDLSTPTPAGIVQLCGLGMMVGVAGWWRRRRSG